MNAIHKVLVSDTWTCREAVDINVNCFVVHRGLVTASTRNKLYPVSNRVPCAITCRAKTSRHGLLACGLAASLIIKGAFFHDI